MLMALPLIRWMAADVRYTAHSGQCTKLYWYGWPRETKKENNIKRILAKQL